MKLTRVKAMVGKVMAIGLVAGAAAFVVPAQAQAQQFAVGVQFGAPYYHDDGRRDFYEHERFERERAEIARREAWERHEAWEQRERWEQHERWEHARDFDHDRDRGAYGYAAPYRGEQREFYGR